MRVINRMAVTLSGQQPYLDWMNNRDAAFPRIEAGAGGDDDAESSPASPGLFIQPARAYGAAVLLPELGDEADVLEWVEENYAWLFDLQLSAWTEDESAWPQDRDLQMFKAWFQVNIHTAVIDAGDDDIEGDEL
jgi:hypothetical protein